MLCKGDAITGAYLVLSGALRVFTTSSAGAEATLYFLNPGDTCVLAANCLFSDTPYPASVQSETPTVVAFIPGRVYRILFAEEQAIQDLTLKAFSGVVSRLMSELEKVHVAGQRERLAEFLLNHASQGVLRITQQRLAGHLGTSREVVARLIGDMVSQGVIHSQRGAVTIKDHAALSRIALQQ